MPVLSQLRKSIIHNDANDYNVLVGENDPFQRKAIGVIDFGDTLFAPTVCELAVGIAYAMMDKVDPLTAATQVITGYHEAFPLTEQEVEVLTR